MAVAKGAEAQSGFRYQISRVIFTRREMLFALFYGISLGLIVFCYGRVFAGADPLIAAGIAAAAGALCFWNMFFGSILGVAGVVCLAFYANNPAAGWTLLLAGIIGLFLLYIWERGHLGFLLVAGAPVLTFFGLAPVLAAGLGIRYGRLRGPSLALAGFLVTVFSTLYVTNPGLLQSANPPLEATLEAESGGLVDRILVEPDLAVIGQGLLQRLENTGLEMGVFLLAWLLGAFLAGSIVVQRDYRDNLATEYLKRVGDDKARQESFLRSSISAAFLGGLIVLATYVLLPMSGVSYQALDQNIALIGGIGVLVLMVLLVFAYKGDPTDVARVSRGAKKGKSTGDASMKSSKMFARDPRETGAEANQAAESVARMRATAGQTATGPRSKAPSLAELRKQSGYTPSTSAAGSTGGVSKASEAQTAPAAADKGETKFEVQGKIDGQYTINKIRSGGMGVVYIVTDDFSGKRYAVKSLRDDFLNNEEAVKRFENEAKTWINLDQNVNIVQAMLYRLIQGRPLLFLEYIDGTDLDKILDMKKDFPLTQILDWAIQVCRGMAYAHSKDVGGGRAGIIHRDLKPANLMLTRNGVIKITDFGLAKAMTESSGLTTDKAGIGTPYYMPPEQLDDAKSVDKRADIYSFGAVLYEFLTGRPPFQSDNIASLYSAIATREPVAPSQLNPDIPEALDRLVLRCLEKKRDHRYASFEEVEDELQAIAAAVPSGTSRSDERAPAAPSSSSATGRASSGRSRAASTAGMSESSGVRDSSGKILIEAIMFIDMVGSTDRGEIGDQLAFEIKEDLDSYVRPQCERRSCTFIKGTGDGYMVAFSTAADAMNAARDIMRKVQTHNKRAAKIRRIDLRIGLNYGEVRLTSDNDRVGQTVNMAARVEGVKSKDFHETRMGVTQDAFAEKNRILLSERMFNEIKSLEGVDTQLIGYFDLKGFTGRHPIYEMRWEE